MSQFSSSGSLGSGPRAGAGARLGLDLESSGADVEGDIDTEVATFMSQVDKGVKSKISYGGANVESRAAAQRPLQRVILHVNADTSDVIMSFIHLINKHCLNVTICA